MSLGAADMFSSAEKMLSSKSNCLYNRVNSILADRESSLINSAHALDMNLNLLLHEAEKLFASECTKLDYLSPIKSLSLGYAIVSQNGQEIKSAADVSVGKSMDVILHDGKISATVESKEEKKYGI